MQNQCNTTYFRVLIENVSSNWRCFRSSEQLECLAPLFHPIRSKIKTSCDSLALVFPRFASATPVHVFISSFDWFTGLPVSAGAIIGDGDRKSWDSRGPMIWDNFSIFRRNCAILTSWIHARAVGSRVDVVTLRDQLVRVARYSCRFFTAMAGNKAEKKNQGSSVYFNALM